MVKLKLQYFGHLMLRADLLGKILILGKTEGKSRRRKQRVTWPPKRVWRRLLRVPWTARRSNQSIRKEINPEYSLEGLMLKLKLQYFGHLMLSVGSLEKTLMLEKFEGRRRSG